MLVVVWVVLSSFVGRGRDEDQEERESLGGFHDGDRHVRTSGASATTRVRAEPVSVGRHCREELVEQ